MNFININNISFSYKNEEDKAINGISLSFQKGKFYAVLGHNGSGKSTLARLLCGLLTPDEGNITIKGLDTAKEENLVTIHQICGMIFQNPDNQIVASVVEEDVAFAPENLGMPTQEIIETVKDCLEIVGMSDYSKHATYKLSGGQKQRIAIAGVLAMNPECIIFDEATSMLDPTGRKEIIAAMKSLNKDKGITVIAITHYMNEASEADEVVVLNKGKVYMQGSPRNIFSQVDKLKKVSLSVPQVTELAYLLNKEGIKIKNDILFTNEMADEIEKMIKTNG